MRVSGLMLLCLLLAPALPAGAQTVYVRDELRINMRTGPGDRFRILRVLVSGDEVTHLAENDGWINVRTEDGKEGWVPAGYVSAAEPASLLLPRVRAQLARAQARVLEVETKLGAQTETANEIDDLRARNTELQTQNDQLLGSARWKSLGIGALIALGGLIVGAMWPRGGAARTRRIKL